MPRGVRVKEGEDFSPSTIKEVIKLLEAEKPITKKAACDMLNMAYNTPRLDKIIEKHKADEEYRKKRKEALKGEPLSNQEKSFIISAYLAGTSMDEIERTSFRPLSKIRKVLDEYAIPPRETAINYQSVILPEESIENSYAQGDLVFSAKYNCTAKVSKKLTDEVYRIWLFDPYMQYACQPYWELGSLVRVQKELGVDVEDFPIDEINQLIREALIKARKTKNAKD